MHLFKNTTTNQESLLKIKILFIKKYIKDHYCLEYTCLILIGNFNLSIKYILNNFQDSAGNFYQHTEYRLQLFYSDFLCIFHIFRNKWDIPNNFCHNILGI